MENIKVSLSADVDKVTISATVTNMPVSVDLADFKREVENAISEAYNKLIKPDWQKIEFHRLNSDTYGNPRYFVDAFDFLSEAERKALDQQGIYKLAHQRAKKLGCRAYTGKQFRGGFVVNYYGTEKFAQSIVRMYNTK
jgi:hypothetical protein